MKPDMSKYPSTLHLEGSRLQPGDEGKPQLRLKELEGYWLVLEEKFDGANSGFSFDEGGGLCLQSRGTYLDLEDEEAYRARALNHMYSFRDAEHARYAAELSAEKWDHWLNFKLWTAHHADQFLERFEDRYLVFGEHMTCKHSVFYDALPHLFLEFDIKDRSTGKFLDTASRRQLIEGLPITQVRVLYEGFAPKKMSDFMDLIGPTSGKTKEWRETLAAIAERRGLDPDQVLAHTDASDTMEGLYGKIEDPENGETVGRFKFVRHSFTQQILDTGTHWKTRPIIPNLLAPGVDIYAPTLEPTPTWRP